jgi:hypothetical protein
MSKYDKMTDEQLEAENQSLMEERIKIKKEQMLINKILDERGAKNEAKKAFDNMNDATKAELKQLISGAGGIESEEKAGTPGTK